MGGRGSGGHNRLSDAEKKRRGTFREDKSEVVMIERAASSVVAGPWLKEIPDPELPLNEHGLKKYNSLCRALFDQNKLTVITRDSAEQAGVLFQEMKRRLDEGRPIPASLSDKYQRALSVLKIAEDAPIINNPEAKKNRFSGSGFAHRRDATVRLLGPAKAKA